MHKLKKSIILAYFLLKKKKTLLVAQSATFTISIDSEIVYTLRDTNSSCFNFD